MAGLVASGQGSRGGRKGGEDQDLDFLFPVKPPQDFPFGGLLHLHGLVVIGKRPTKRL